MFRSRRARSTRMDKTKDMEDLGGDCAWFDQIAKSRFSNVVSNRCDCRDDSSPGVALPGFFHHHAPGRPTQPTRRSARGACDGDGGAAGTSSMPRPSKRGRNGSPKMPSRSRSMSLGAVSSGKASMICWPVHCALGNSLTSK